MEEYELYLLLGDLAIINLSYEEYQKEQRLLQIAIEKEEKETLNLINNEYNAH